MKKIITVFIAMVLICSVKKIAYAAPADPDAYVDDVVFQAVINEIERAYSIEVPDVVQKAWWNAGYNNVDNYYLWIRKSSSYIDFYFYSSATYNDETHYLNCVNPGYRSAYEIRTASFQANATTNWNVLINDQTDQIVGYYLDLIQMDDDIDYSIPIPDARMVTLDNSVVNWDESPINNFILQIKTPNVDLTNLNVEVIAKYYTPSKVYLNTYMWNQTEYNVAEYLQSSQDNIISLASRTRLIDLPVNTNTEYRWQVDLDVNNGWENFYNSSVTAGVPDFYWAASGDEVTQGEALMAIGKFISKQPYMPSAFNICEVFVRYYKVDGSTIKLGQWLHLKNDTVLDNESLNVNMPVLNPPISQATDDNIDSPDNNNSIVTGVWLPSSPQDAINVVVNNNMPQQNTLNYPTIVSYNHDIAFKQYADTAKNIPDFFTDVTNFATMAFSFIPPEVWAIVSMGLLLSIAVMVIKIL